MKINGLKVDTQAIADGLYAIITEKGEEAIVAFGMIPKWIMDLLEVQLREKIIRIVCEQMRFNEAETKHLVELDKLGMLVNSGTISAGFSEEKLKETMQPIIHEVSVGIYGAAARAGKMIV
jgi:hypothetical protein